MGQDDFEVGRQLGQGAGGGNTKLPCVLREKEMLCLCRIPAHYEPYFVLAVVFLGTQRGSGEELALKKMDTGALDAEDVELVRYFFCCLTVEHLSFSRVCRSLACSKPPSLSSTVVKKNICKELPILIGLLDLRFSHSHIIFTCRFGRR